MGQTQKVVGPDLTPDWLEKRRGIMYELDGQLIRGALTLEQLQIVTEHRNPFTEAKTEPAAAVGKAEPPQPAPQFPPVPALNEVFDLEINHDLDITPSGWEAPDSVFPKGTRTYRCRLLDLGNCSNRADALRKIGQKAKELNVKFVAGPGPAREAFLAKYPRHSGRPIVMAGQEWRDLYRHPRVPFLSHWGVNRFRPDFRWSGGGFPEICLFLVVEQDA